MHEQEKRFVAHDGKQIVYHCWRQDTQPVRAIVQIVHGMAEHSLRYRWFASKLTEQGYAVYADDHRGHGKTAGSAQELTHLGPGAAECMLRDEEQLSELIAQEYPGKARIIFSHSMGSFIVRCLLARCGDTIDAAVICGTGYKSVSYTSTAMGFAWLLRKLQGERRRSHMLDTLTFGSYNRFFEKRTAFDWLSRDQAEVDRYIDDPLCGVLCTTGFFYNLFALARKAAQAETIHATPRSLPIFFISGSKDPVGGYGAEVTRLFHAFQRQGVTRCSLKLFPEARHELINETNKAEVFEAISSWIAGQVSGK